VTKKERVENEGVSARSARTHEEIAGTRPASSTPELLTHHTRGRGVKLGGREGDHIKKTVSPAHSEEKAPLKIQRRQTEGNMEERKLGNLEGPYTCRDAARQHKKTKKRESQHKKAGQNLRDGTDVVSEPLKHYQVERKLS